jgi:hypothetical protein
MKKHCDPNGIRTRVTAVKGRCPGPLDDRVTKAGQYRNCYSLTQGKLPNCFQALGLARLRGAHLLLVAAATASYLVHESTPLRARLRPDAYSKLRARFGRDVGALRYRAKARRLFVQVNRYREP